jgi:hypothetical protein
MHPMTHKRFFWVAAMMLIVAMGTLTGCVQEVEVVDATPAAGTTEDPGDGSSLQGAEGNLAVVAVDFDPPLNYEQLILLRQSITLLVTIANTGDVRQDDVTVRAELTSPEDAELFITQGASLSSIAPGESQVVRFAPLSGIPHLQAFHLEVMVDAGEGERELHDNRRAFEIQIIPEATQP